MRYSNRAVIYSNTVYHALYYNCPHIWMAALWHYLNNAMHTNVIRSSTFWPLDLQTCQLFMYQIYELVKVLKPSLLITTYWPDIVQNSESFSLQLHWCPLDSEYHIQIGNNIRSSTLTVACCITDCYIGNYQSSSISVIFQSLDNLHTSVIKAFCLASPHNSQLNPAHATKYSTTINLASTKFSNFVYWWNCPYKF